MSELERPEHPIKFNPLCTNPDEIERMWYIPSYTPVKSGWMLYSETLVLSQLQGCFEQPDKVKRTTGWRVAGGGVRSIMAIGQALLMFFCMIPILSWLMYMLARSMPRNVVGFFLRGCYWKTKLRHLGVDTFIDQGVEFTRPHTIEIGNRCHIDRYVLFSVGCDDGYIRIGDYSFIGPYSHVAGRGGVEIGRFVGLAARVHLYSVTNLPFHSERLGELNSMSHSVPTDFQNTVEGKVDIGDYSVIGMGTLVLPGVHLGRGAIVHPYSEVRDSFAKFAIVSGHGRAKRIGWRRPARLDPRLQSTHGVQDEA